MGIPNSNNEPNRDPLLNNTLAHIERTIEIGQVTLWGTSDPNSDSLNAFREILGNTGDTVTITGSNNGLLLLDPAQHNYFDSELIPSTNTVITGTYLGLTVIRCVLGNPIGEMPEFLVDHPESLPSRLMGDLSELGAVRAQSLFEFGVVLRNVIVNPNNPASEPILLGDGNYLLLHDWNSDLENNSRENRT